MLRRGPSGTRDDRSREVQMPVSDILAAAIAAKETADAQERAHIKRLVLQVPQIPLKCIPDP